MLKTNPEIIKDGEYFAVYGMEIFSCVPINSFKIGFKKERTITIVRPEFRRLFESTKYYDWVKFFILTEDEIMEHIVKENI